MKNHHLYLFIPVFLVALMLLSSHIPLLRAAVITEYSVPGDLSSIPREMVVDNDGWLWFTEYGGHEIGRFKDGAFREFFLSAGSFPWGIDFDSPDWIYFSDSPNRKISRIRSSGGDTRIEEFLLPADYSDGIRGVAVQDDDTSENDDNIWFADYGGHRIGLLILDGGSFEVIGWTLPSESTPESLVYTSSTGLWCTDFRNDRIWNIPNSTDPIIKFVELPDGSEPVDIDVDSFGNLWFTLSERNSIGRFNPRLNELTEYRIPTSSSEPHGIVVDFSNRVWFAEGASNKIGFFNPDTETFVEFARIGSGGPTYLATNRESAERSRRLPIFFSDSNFGKIGRIDPHEGFTTTIVDFLTKATTTSTTGMSTSTLPTGTTGYFTYSYSSASTEATLTFVEETATTFTATETVKIVRTSASDISTIFSTVMGTTTAFTTLSGTFTSFIATTSGTTTRFDTFTSYIETAFGTTTQTVTFTSTSFTLTTGTTDVPPIIPGFSSWTILTGIAAGLFSIFLTKRALRTRRQTASGNR